MIWRPFRWFDKLQDREMKNAEDIRLLRKELIASREETEQKRAEDIGEFHDEIKAVKDEAIIMVEGVGACLDGLRQLGANHSVTDAKEKLDDYINIAAHR